MDQYRATVTCRSVLVAPWLLIDVSFFRTFQDSIVPSKMGEEAKPSLAPHKLVRTMPHQAGETPNFTQVDCRNKLTRLAS